MLVNLLLTLILSAHAAETTVPQTLSLDSLPASLDWGGQATMIESPIISNICEGLFSYNTATRKAEPAVAEKLTQNQNHTEYTFTISKNALWSDGRPVYAKDFVDGWKRLASKGSSSIYNFYLDPVLRVNDEPQIKALDDRTLWVKMSQPTPNFELVTAFWALCPVRKDLMEKYGPNWWKGGVSTTNGPFYVDSYEAGKSMLLKRNPYYKKALGNVKAFQLYFRQPEATEQAQFASGTLPFIRIKSKSKAQGLRMTPAVTHISMVVNSQKFPMNSAEFRKAIFHSINTTEIQKTLADPTLPEADQLIPHSFRIFQKSIKAPFNPAEARAHLAKSSIVGSARTKIILLTRLKYPYDKIGALIKDQISKTLGITVDLMAVNTEEFAAYTSLNNYDLAIIFWTAKTPSPQDFLLPYASQDANSRLKYFNPLFAQYIDLGARATNANDALKYFDRAQLLYLQDDSAVYPLFFQSGLYQVSKRVEKLDFNYLGDPLLNTFKIR